MNITIKTARSESELFRVFHFRYRMQTLGMQSLPAHANRANQSIENPLDRESRLLIAERSNGEIVGSLRLVFLRALKKKAIATLNIENGSEFSQLIATNDMAYLDDIQINPDYKNHTLISLLFHAAFELLLSENIKLCFTNCIPDTLKFYERLGFKPIRQATKRKQTTQTLVMIPQDLKAQKEVASPFAPLIEAKQDDHGATLKSIQHFLAHGDMPSAVAPSDVRTFWARFSDQQARLIVKKPFLLQNLNTEEVRELLKLARRMSFTEGEIVPCLHSEYLNQGIILQGEIGQGITRGEDDTHHWINIFREGDAIATSDIKSSKLIALEHAEIALFPSTLIEELRACNPILATRLTMNFIACLQQECDSLENFNAQCEDQFDVRVYESIQ